MLDADLAELYQVETKALDRAVHRNIDRFPSDLCFISPQRKPIFEVPILAPQTQTAVAAVYLPYAFGEHDVAMLSSVLNSERAVQMNILIIRAFVKMRELLATHKDLAMATSCIFTLNAMADQFEADLQQLKAEYKL